MDIHGGIRGEWPGLEQAQLYDARDLKIATDFREVLSELVTNHLGNRQVGAVFPGYEADANNDLGQGTSLGGNPLLPPKPMIAGHPPPPHPHPCKPNPLCR